MMRYLLLTNFLGLFFLCSCTESFETINTNPNAPASVQPEFLLRQVVYGYGNDMGREGFAGGSLLGQHFAMTDFNLFDRHELSSPQEGGDPWPIFYTALRNNETLLEASRTDVASAVYEGPALVMKAYLAMILTDIFGDVPYFTAFQAQRNDVAKPAYDSQESIYLGPGGILDNLAEAVRVMDADNGLFELRGDLLYEGDLTAWVRLANSLRIKALMRYSTKRNPDGLIQQLVTEGRILTSNAQNATFRFAAAPPNSFPLATEREGIFNSFKLSSTAESILTDLEDPRIATFYQSAAADGSFVGVANGIVGGSEFDARVARPGTIWRETSSDLSFNFMTAWELDFWLAEAVLSGYLEGDARAYYEDGVTKAFQYWMTDLPDDYLMEGPAAYDGPSAYEQIITQKWIANIANVYEGWNEWRRTGIPALQPVAASLNGGQIPIRMPYPSEEQALNFENYSAAAAATNDNSVNFPVFWDE